MAGILGIDLDIAELRLAELQQTAAGYQLHAALALPTGAVDAATVGAQLKERLKEVGFKANSVVIALAHDAMTCREVRHPNIHANELPAIVQFQVLKESSVPMDDAVVDYVPLTQPLSTGERRSLTYVVRKPRIKFCEELCEAAGLKLLAIVPRAVALLAAFAKAKSDNKETIGYACSNTFFVMHQGELIFNRSLGSPYDATELLNELRRSIAGYENQANVPALDHVMLAGHELSAEAQKQLSTFRIPVRLFDPYLGIAGAERLLGHGDYAVACGAAQVTKAFKKPPVEFLEPKKVVVKPNRTRSYAIYGGAAALALAALIGGIYWMITSSADAEIAEIQERIKRQQSIEKVYVDGQIEKRYDAIKAWKDQELFVLEEIYDLMEIFPDVAGVQIVKAEWKATAAPTTAPVSNFPVAGAKTAPGAGTAQPPKTTVVKPIARLSVRATAEKEDDLKALETALRSSKHWKWVKSDLVMNEKNTRIYELDVTPWKPDDYRTVITIGSNTTSTESTTNTRPGQRRLRPTGGGRP